MSGMDQQKQAFNPLLACLAALFFVFPLIGMITGAPWAVRTANATQRQWVTARPQAHGFPF